MVTSCRGEGEGILADFQLSGLSKRVIGDALPERGSLERGGREGCGGAEWGRVKMRPVLDV